MYFCASACFHPIVCTVGSILPFMLYLFLILLFSLSPVCTIAQQPLCPSPASTSLTLLFVGDLMQHKAQIDAAYDASGLYHYDACFAKVKQRIQEADIAIGNLEVTLGGKPYSGYPMFSAPDAFLPALSEAGFDILLTANNHCLDRGKRGLERTILQLDSMKILHAGTYLNTHDRSKRYPLLIEKKGFRIALLNYTYGTNGIPVTAPNIVNYIDKEQIIKDIQSAQSSRPDAIIACMHWGDEYKLLPNREQQELADWLITQGVSHIIGSHPHVVQPMELRNNQMQQHVVVYSLGNFISNMSAPNTDGGAIVSLTLEKQMLNTPIPPRIPPHSYAPSFDTTTLASSFCRVAACTYSLVWTGRPNLTGNKNFMLYPVDDASIPSLSTKARNKLKIFTEATRKLFKEHNIGIEEEKKCTKNEKKAQNILQK